jgi:uncharacterized protein (TIGR02391 family)
MDRDKALELLKQALTEIPHLRELHYDNQECKLWHDKVRNIIKAALNSEDVKRFASYRPIHLRGMFSENVYQEDYLKKLEDYETALKSIIQKYELLGFEKEPATTAEAEKTTESPIQLFDKMRFHSKVVEASRELFKDGHYRDAIYRAFVEVNNSVKRRAKSQLDGKKLMSTVFNPDNPIIKLNPLETQTDKDEQEGFMHLFMGAMQGIRNPKAHENIIQNNPYIAIKLIGFASLLIEIISFWKVENS